MTDEITEDFSTLNDVDEDEFDNTEIESIHSDINSTYDDIDEEDIEDDEEDIDDNHDESKYTNMSHNKSYTILYGTERNTSPYLTKYEIARVLSIRACQIQLGAEPLIESETTDPYTLAKEELLNKEMPLKIYRPISNNLLEEWSVNELELIEEIITD